jgi:PAS domain S-box-containing protein
MAKAAGKPGTRPKENAEALTRRVEDLAARLAEAEETLRAIRGGEVDALLVATTEGERVYTLAGSERPYRILIEAMGEGALTLSRDGTILFANRAFAKIVGRPLEQVVGAHLARFLPKDKGAGLEALLAEGALGSQRQEAELLSEGGVEVPVLLALTPLPESDPPQVCLVVTNLSEAKRREAELVRLYEALKETTRTLEELVQVSPAGIFVLDPEGKVLLWNPAMEKIHGWAEEEVLGRLVPTVAAGQEGARENLERLLAGERLAGVELRRLRKDGQPVDLLLWTAPIREDTGGLRSTVVIVLDVTHLKEVERIALVQQKLTSLGQVAVGVAHEIRNPLSGINLYLHSLETFFSEWEIPNPEIRETTETVIAGMKGASARMEATIQRVLSFSRPGPPRMEPLDVNLCIREAVAMARISLQKAGARVAVALREDLPICRGDMGLLKQALINLMTNAAQALEKQEGQRLIEISSSRVGCTSGYGYHVTVSVADSGPGIPEDVRERIFDPFFTTKKWGTGIGLPITHKIITDHRGFIKVGTSRFGGALFTIGLPTGDEGKI